MRAASSSSIGISFAASLLTYIIPSSTLIVPFHRVMHTYGLLDNPSAVIAAEVTFATPYAILVLLHNEFTWEIWPSQATRIAVESGSVVLGAMLLIWSLMCPVGSSAIRNML
jgi:hypothetical protein